MAVERHFLGWDGPVTDKARLFLLPSQISGPVDLESHLIVVPTGQAGRRLREALAMHCAEQNTALLSPRVVTPSFFLHSEHATGRVANKTEVTAVWIDVLMKADISRYSAFFPAQTTEQSFTWAMQTGGLLQKLCDTLADGGHHIVDIVARYGGILEEQQRWEDMARLEVAYLTRLAELGLDDPCDTMIRQAEQPELPEGVERIIVASVPDPTPLTLRVLEHLSSRVTVDILVHAPESAADCFDEWGRPITERWIDSEIAIPDPQSNVILTGSLMSQSHKVVEVMSEETHRFGPADIAIGVPNSEITPFLMADLGDSHLIAFDPAGKSLTDHPLYRVLESFCALVTEGTYASVSAFMRHVDVLTILSTKHRISPRRLLQELDEFQSEHLPLGIEDIADRLLARAPRDSQDFPEFRSLRKAMLFAHRQLESFHQQDMDTAVRSLLQELYEVRTINPGEPEDEEFVAASRLIDTALQELSSEVIGSIGIDRKNALQILLHRLSSQRYSVERQGAVIDLEGWLELPWNPARLMIVTGMNDGFVPDGQLSDAFLPDTLRKQLGLRCDADRLARDAYLMRGLIESHSNDGRVCFLVSKTGATRDPLKPSRLLFRCSDAELPRRAGQLFGDPEDEQAGFPPTISFRLQPAPPADIPTDRVDPGRLSVTKLKEYLQCPFRFYLKNVLGMEALGDEKVEMDALDFGSLVHDVLSQIPRSPEMVRCDDPTRLAEFLSAEADRWATGRFGDPLPLQIRIQLDAARQRLRVAARVQSDLVKAGWQITDSEVSIKAELCGMPIGGRIDRIDRHSKTGRIRILDYKTSDHPQKPDEAHLSSVVDGIPDYMMVTVEDKEKRWVDLQLPLYNLLLPEEGFFGSTVELGYFNLPKATDETGVVIWDGLDDYLLASARLCAGSVVEDIRNRRFWPPIKRVKYDDFESLFAGDIPDCIDVEAFEAFMRRETK